MTSKKKATPADNESPNTKLNISNSKMKAKAPYQFRCLTALVHGVIERSDLDKAIGTTNAPEFVKQLRGKGLLIHMTKVSFINRDGRKGWRGKYQLDPGSREKALLLLDGE